MSWPQEESVAPAKAPRSADLAVRAVVSVLSLGTAAWLWYLGSIAAWFAQGESPTAAQQVGPDALWFFAWSWFAFGVLGAWSIRRVRLGAGILVLVTLGCFALVSLVDPSGGARFGG